MAKTAKNSNSVLFLYEGETEHEFYKKIFALTGTERQLRIAKSNLKGVYSLNQKVKSKIQTYLGNASFYDCNNIHVIVAYDREGDRATEPSLGITALEKEFIAKKSRIKSINQIVATQDLESWFFHDMPGIFKYLSVPVKDRKPEKHSNVDATNNRILSKMFHAHGEHYQKGKRVEGFIDSLDLQKIIGEVNELQELIAILKSLVK